MRLSAVLPKEADTVRVARSSALPAEDSVPKIMILGAVGVSAKPTASWQSALHGWSADRALITVARQIRPNIALGRRALYGLKVT